MNQLSTIEVSEIWKFLETIPDPEIPVISIVELGVIREIKWVDDVLEISITPTYSGCPAMRTMEIDIDTTLRAHGINNFLLKTIYSPAWTTDWMSVEAKSKLKDYGIAPPQQHTSQRINALLSDDDLKIVCPQCNSNQTKLISEFGSTACKALYQCKDCLETFDYFKCI